MNPGIIASIVAGSLALVVVLSGLRVIREYQRGVVLRLGRRGPLLAPGLRLMLPLGIDRLTRVDLRSAPLRVPAHEVITHDGVPVRVSAAVHLQLLNPMLAVTRVVDFRDSTAQLVHAALREVAATTTLRDLLLNQVSVRDALVRLVDARTEPWGIAVTSVDLEDVLLPDAMQRAMARQSELRGAETMERLPDGGLEVSRQLEQDARILAGQPADVQARFLEALNEVRHGDARVVVVPLPAELVQPFVDLQGHTIPAARPVPPEEGLEASPLSSSQQH